VHHLVRERYPRFNDALSDLDDALTLTYLFAALPSTTSIKSKVVNKAKQLASAWGAYCSTTACITKSFISVKGVYLEATIKGLPVRWVVPHSFTQFMPEDVDYRVMTSFFEFYETLLHFVLYKLYTDLGVRYPLPSVEAGGEVVGSTSYILGSNLRSLTNALKGPSGAITNVVSETVEDENQIERSKKSKAEKKKEKALIKSVGAALNSINEDSDSGDDDDEGDVDIAGPLKAALESMADDEARAAIPGGESEMDEDSLKRRRLFSGLTFFLSREVPLGYLELVCLAFGGNVGWEGPNSPISENDPAITHHIVDRPKLPNSYDSLPKSREFVQPQWILDCSNFMFLLPIAKYAVGAALPPHLSPWVDNEEEGYKPVYAEEIERLRNGDVVVAADEAEDQRMEAESSEAEEIEEAEEADKSGSEEDEKEEEDPKEALKKKKKRDAKRKKEEDEETHALAKTMMSRKAAHLYGRMQHGIKERKAKVTQLETRRREIDHGKANDDDGRTPLKQKVDRLKKEQQMIMKEYSNAGGSMKKGKKKRRVEES
jgi:pescadillo protein